MKASIIAVAAGAALVLAGPLEKRVTLTETMWDITTTTVFVDEPAGATPKSNAGQRPHEQHANAHPNKPASTPAPAPVVVKETQEAAPAPAPTTEKPKTASAPAESSAQAQASSKPANADAPVAGDMASVSVHHHNIHRANNSAPDVAWSEELAGYAATVAKSCHFKHDLTPGGGGYGQNIAMYAASDLTADYDLTKAIAKSITSFWYNGELSLYPVYGSEPDMGKFEAWGHYSQVVWSGTQQVGCAVQYCDANSKLSSMPGWYSVCNYHPAGNVNGQYADNVKAPKGLASVTA